MAKRRTRPKPAPSAPPEPNPRRLSIDASASGGAETLRLFPHELQPGDIWRDEHGAEWRVAAAPHTYREGKRVGVRMVLVRDADSHVGARLGGARAGGGAA